MAKTNQEITEALTVLTPTAKYTVSGTTIIWNDSDVAQPSDSAIDTEIARQKSDYTAKEYQRNRKAEYPSIPDQLDDCLLYTSPSPRDGLLSRMPSSA